MKKTLTNADTGKAFKRVYPVTGRSYYLVPTKTEKWPQYRAEVLTDDRWEIMACTFSGEGWFEEVSRLEALVILGRKE